MPPESAIDQVLSLKKRARRRLVGAIAMVLLMLIILPNVLKDRSALDKRTAIKLTMPASVNDTYESSEQKLAPMDESQNNETNSDEAQTAEKSAESVISTEDLPEKIIVNKAPPIDDSLIKQANETSKAQVQKLSDEPTKKLLKNTASASAEKKSPSKVTVKAPVKEIAEKKRATPNETKTQTSNTPAKDEGLKPQRFLIQIGVYSDVANVKQLQAKITQAGFTSRTAKLNTDKGEKIRLRVGSYESREAAAEVLKKLQGNGLSGMVLIDE